MRRPLLTALVLCCAAASAFAQIEFPEEPVRGAKPPATPPEVSAPADSEPAPAAGEQGTPSDDPAAVGEAAGALGTLPVGRKDAAKFIFEKVAGLKDDVNHPMVAQAVQSLSGLADDGREAARVGLASERAATILVSARVLLTSPAAEDRELVVRRFSTKLPAAVGGPLVDAYAELDPVSASPVALAGLLDHPLAGVRAAASRRLVGVTDPALFPALGARFASSRADTRLRALELLAAFDLPETAKRLEERLGDPAALVAGRAATLLAAREGESTVGDLRRKAFDQQWILRESAYAILALIEREDARVESCLDERHVPALLEGLRSSDAFVAGTCAAALAGIGFRGARPEEAPWLDREVPERLVLCVGGAEFHADYSSLQRPAARRLALISGQAFASDGPSWMRWWSESRASFRARRAVIDAGPEAADSLQVVWRDERSGGESFELLGPTAARGAATPGEVVLRIGRREARDVVDLLLETRVFTAERLPGARGSATLAGRTLAIGIAGQGKSFRFAGTSSEPWFETVAAALHSVRERNRWQIYPSPRRHAGAEDLWLEQFAWWDAEHTETERALRLKALVLEALPALPLERRAEGIAELVAIYRASEHVEAADLPAILGLLGEEPFYTPRAIALLDLALAHVAPGSGNVAVDPAQRDMRVAGLEELALARFGARAPEALGKILRRAGPQSVRAATMDSRAALRAVAADPLLDPELGLGTPDDVAVALALLEDAELDVRVAAVEALGRRRVEAARQALLSRARQADEPRLRAAALEAVSILGGEGAIDAIVTGLASPAPTVKVAAARGLARVGDPSAAPLLVSLLGQGRGSDLFEAARQGLSALGEAATPDLLRAINTPGHRARREGALLLAQLGVPEAVPVLMAILSDDPEDSLVAAELAVVTCVDFRRAGNPATEWWDWWESVVHDAPAAWLCAAGQRLSIVTPDPAELGAKPTRRAVRFLTTLLRRSEPHLVERARRDLGRILGRDLGLLPPPGDALEGRIAELERELAERFPQ